ncbi:MAG: hypothetical protein ACI4TX_04840 [Christensenellales bacterium]
MKIWTNVLLSSYGNLINFADAVDKKIEALSNFDCSGRLSALDTSIKIIDLMEKKVSLCNTKVLIEDVLKRLDYDSARMILLKYLDRVGLDKIARLLKINLRTAYRKLIKAKESFGHVLIEMGYNETRLTNMYKNQLWLYNNYLNERINQIAKNKIKTINKEDYATMSAIY